jgi:transcriptional regulator with XRE-family HTH domain
VIQDFRSAPLGLSGASLAELLDVAPETVSRWESGKRPVDRAAVAVLGSLVVDSLNQRTETIDRLRALREPPKLGKTVHLDVAAAA